MVQQEAERRGIRRFNIVFDESATMQKISEEEAGSDNNEEVDEEDRDERGVGRGGRRSKQPVGRWYELHELRPYMIKHAMTRELGPVERRKRATRSVEAATPTPVQLLESCLYWLVGVAASAAKRPRSAAAAMGCSVDLQGAQAVRSRC